MKSVGITLQQKNNTVSPLNYQQREGIPYLWMLIIDLFHAFIFVQMDVYNVNDIELIQKLIGRLVAANELKELKVSDKCTDLLNQMVATIE